MGSIDATIVSTAIPRIESGLHARLNWTGWTITIYQLGSVLASPLAGKLSDQFGRKRVFVLCTVVFTTSSFACGLSSSIFMLIGLRFVQALGGGGFMPSAVGIVSDTFGSDRDRAIGMFSSIQPIGGILGPVFGGIIAEFWTWRGIFYINVPIGLAVLLLTYRVIPDAAPSESARFDFRGLGLLSGTILTGMFAITMLGERGASLVELRFLLPTAATLAFGWVFVRHTRTAVAPFIPYRLFTARGFGVMNALNALYGTAVFGFGAVAPLYAENRYHIPLSTAGTMQSARSIGMISIAAATAVRLRRIGYRRPMMVGFFVTGMGIFMLSIAARGISSYWWLVIFSTLAGLGMGCAAPATNNAILQLAPDQVAAVTGLRSMFRQSGGILFISVDTALLARSVHPGLLQAHVFVIQAGLLVVMSALSWRVPDHRGSW